MAAFNPAGTIFRLIRDSLLAPFTSIYEFALGGFYFLRDFPHYSNVDKLNQDTRDYPARFYSFTMGLSRIGGFILTGLCILGFIGALAVPFPGVAPIYTLSVGAVLKALGITIGTAMLGRAAGALAGSVIDFFGYRKKRYIRNSEATKPNVGHVIKTTLTIGIFGSNQRTLTGLVQLMHQHTIDILPVPANNNTETHPKEHKSHPNKRSAQENSISNDASDDPGQNNRNSHSRVAQQLQTGLQPEHLRGNSVFLGSQIEDHPSSEASTPPSDLPIDFSPVCIEDPFALRIGDESDEEKSPIKFKNSLDQRDSLDDSTDQQNVPPPLPKNTMRLGTPQHVTLANWDPLEEEKDSKVELISSRRKIA